MTETANGVLLRVGEYYETVEIALNGLSRVDLLGQVPVYGTESAERIESAEDGAMVSGLAGDDTLIGLGRDMVLAHGTGDDVVRLGKFGGTAAGSPTSYGNDTISASMVRAVEVDITSSEGNALIELDGMGRNGKIATATLRNFGPQSDPLEINGQIVDLHDLPEGMALSETEGSAVLSVAQAGQSADLVVFKGWSMADLLKYAAPPKLTCTAQAHRHRRA